MKNDIYNIPENNYELILDYFETTYKNINGYLDSIKKFKEITNAYCKKVKSLFNEIKSNNNNRAINTYCIITDKDSNINDKNNLFKTGIDTNNKELSSIDHNMSKINKFFNEFIESMETFLESIASPIESFNRNIEIYNEEISSIKFIHDEEKKSFLLKYNKFDVLNNQLHTLYNEVEKNLMSYCISRKKNKNKYKLDENLSLFMSKMEQKEGEIIESSKKLDSSFGKNFLVLTNQKINSIKDFIPGLIQKSDIFTNSFFDCFNKSYLEKINQMKTNENNKDVGNEIKSKIKIELDKFDKFDKLIEKDLKEKNMVINLEEYSIKVIDNNEDLSDKEVCFIVKNMYNNFKLINKTKYNVEIAEKQFKLKKIIDKLFSYGYIKKNDNKNKKNENDNYWKFLDIGIKEYDKMIKKERKTINKITVEEKVEPEEVDILCDSMSIREHRKYFLLRINNFRTLGEFSMPLEIFNYTTKVFSAISKNLFYENEKNENKLDIGNSQLVIILSQTFYYLKNGEKVYIQNELSKEEIYHKDEFWNLLLKSMINMELENLKMNPNQKVKNIELEESIVFSQILSFVSGMPGFGISVEDIKKIIMPFVNQYKIGEKNLEIINNMIKNQK